MKKKAKGDMLFQNLLSLFHGHSTFHSKSKVLIIGVELNFCISHSHYIRW
ncbi:hypothetical protein SAMN04488587_1617 [Methanococcoides vulcani]|uniref:Uncharacterized protein n=1 Tax=Methanococcoides vulcani TaxID=1353158 RepID=A0A1I0AES0_9EURY|nr:hypothetical protein SAMN04488587_1617 [Methanococcoides vulcani]